MREIGKTEIFRYKCSICGSNNKKFIPIMWKKIPYGYALHCCNCGHVDEFIHPPKHIGGLYNGNFEMGGTSTQRCYMLNECPHKTCQLYGSYKPDEDSGYDDEQGVPGDTETDDGTSKDELHLGVYANNNSNIDELEVKVNTYNSCEKFL